MVLLLDSVMPWYGGMVCMHICGSVIVLHEKLRCIRKGGIHMMI